MEAVAEVVQKRETPEAATFLAKAAWPRAVCCAINLGAECAVFDAELSGSQIRNLEELLGGAGHRPHHADFGDIRKPGRDK